MVLGCIAPGLIIDMEFQGFLFTPIKENNRYVLNNWGGHGGGEE